MLCRDWSIEARSSTFSGRKTCTRWHAMAREAYEWVKAVAE